MVCGAGEETARTALWKHGGGEVLLAGAHLAYELGAVGVLRPRLFFVLVRACGSDSMTRSSVAMEMRSPARSRNFREFLMGCSQPRCQNASCE